MAQRYDIVKIDFQANARGANAAIEALRQQAEKCNGRVVALKEELKTAINANMPADQIDALRSKLNGAQKEARQFSNAYKELVKGMRTLDQGIKAFNDGTLDQMNQAFQKAVYNAAKLTRTKLDPMSDSYKKDYRELTSLMDASQQNYARLQGDAQQMLKTLRDGGKVSRQALTEELNAQKELLQVLAETDKGYQRTKMNVDQLSHYLQRMGGDYDYIRKNITDTQKVSDEMLRTMYRELEQTNNEGKVTKKMLQENAKAMREIRAEQERRVQNVLGGDLSKQSEGNIRTAIANAKELMSVYGSTSKQAQTLAAQIVNAEEHLKQHGIEGERAARKEAEAVQLLADKHKMMQDRVKNLGNLSASALAETQKYWEAQRDGAERTSAAYKKAEKNLKAINAEIQRQATAQLQTDASKLGRKNLATLSEQELQTSIAAAKQLAASMKSTDPAYKQLVDNIVRAEQHIKQFGLEGQRSTRQAADQLQTMTDRMAKLKTLSAASLEETRRFWQTQMDGATRGSQAYKTAEQNIKQVVAEQERLTAEQNKAAASQLLKKGNLTTMSEGEIRRAIEAAKQYQQTLSTSDAAHQRLSKAIVNAEEHIKKYGIEAERSARKEAAAAAEAAKKRKETDKMMSDQLKQGTALSESALRAQQQYWQRLIDDPKTAATSLRHYQAQLERTKKLQEQMAANRIKTEGQSALAFFRGDTSNASATQIQEQAKALKAYRDSLPQKANAQLIEEIDALLLKAGQSAKKAAQDTMPLRDAYRIAMQSLQGSFKGTTEQLKQAKKALEEQLLLADKGSKRYNQLQRALNGIALEEKRVGELSREVQAVLDQPKGRSYNALKQAVEQGRAALQNMDRTTKEGQKQFDELAKKVKAADQEMKQLAATSKGTSTAFEKAWSRVKTYIGVYVGTAVAMQKVTATMRDLMDLSDRMGEVRKTTGFTADEVGRLSDNLKKMDVRTSLTSLMEISASAGQLGLKTLEDVQGFTEAANKLMIALPEMGREAATEMMRVAIATGEVDKIRKQLQEGTIEGSSATAVAMEKIASTIDRLRASSASTAPEITDFVKRVGAVGAQSGITIDQVAALGSTVSSLGMRIEMSATALSRMIPAIRNNAFELAKAIGVTPDTIRNLFDTGRGMEVILMILQRIKDTGMDADSVEQMLGMAGMRDIMKDLNQQGARAGIVFSGLSQNVDELRRQLGVAGEAYEENIAIQQEFDKMNETTAAKWERLKNALEEGFVGDKPQRLLGGIIDGLRKIVDFMVGDSSISSAFRTILVYLGLVRMQLISLAAGALKSVGGGLRNIGIMLGFIKGEMTKLQWGNIFTALAGAVLYAYMAFKDLKSATEKASEALGKTKDDVARAQEQFEGYWRKLKDTSVALEQARKSHDQLSAEVDKLRNSTDKGAAATENLRKKEDELKKSEDNVAKASNDHKTAISQMNNIYGKYLGFILTETNYANLAAAAHDKVAAAIEREMLMKQKQAAISEVDSNYSADIASNYGKLSERLTQQGLNRSQASQAMADLQKFLRENVSYDAVNNQTVVSKAVTDQLKKSGLNLSKATSNEIVALWYDKYLKDTYHLSDRARMNITGVNRTADRDEGWQNAYSPFATNVRGGYANTYVQRERERGSVSAVYNADLSRVEGEETKAAGTLLQRLEKEANDAKTKILDKATSDKDRNDAYINLANALEGLDNRINELDPKRDAETINRLRDMAKSLSGEGISIKKLTAARREIHSTLFDRATFDENTIREAGNATPWGTSEPGESTNWKEMTAEQLVNRREQMNKFVNSLQTDTDVKAVLNEDKALKKAIEAGMSSDMRTVIEWYNTERLKIQDELHARHLTNTGDWLDPKKERGAKKQFRDEMDAYLHELDAYYTERKTRIEQARNDEEITEGEAWRRTIQNDNEWQTRRAELQKLYSRKQKEVTQEELDAIIRIIAERTGDSEAFVKAAIAKTNQFVDAIEKSGDKGAAIVHRWMSQVVLDTERSYLKAAQAIGKQIKFIEDTLAKERPYDGITKNLQDNLDKMGVQAVKYRRENEELARQNKEPKYSNEQITAQSYDEMAFYLRQAADAYSIDIDELLRRMVKEGMTATAEEISKSDMLKQAVMGQLRKTYQEVQDAVKKEASQIKKDVEIIWNDDARGIGGMSMKATFDKALAQLGMQQDSVSRANSLIGAGAASDNVASRLAMKQIEVQMRMQKAQYDMYRVQANQRMAALKAEAEEHRRLAKQMEKENHLAESKRELLKATNAERDAENVHLSLGLTLAEETKKEEQKKAELLKIQEESQNRLYTSLREWADLLTSSLQGVFEASHAGDAEYYNEMAKLNLTGKGGPGAGTYMVIDDAGTSNATAHYEHLDERQALERQHEIERENAMAEAWEKLWDDINMKMSEQITDWVNASLQDAAVKDNTDALLANTRALYESMGIETGEPIVIPSGSTNTEAPKVVGTDSENTSATNANTAALNTLTQVITGQPVTGSTSMGTATAATETTATAEGDISLQKPFFQMSAEETAAAMEMIRQMWQTYNEGGTEALQVMAEELAAMEGIVLPPWQVTEEGMATAMERMGALWQSYAEQGIAAMQQMSDAMAEMPNKIPDPTQLTEKHAEQAVQNATNMYQGLGEVQVQAQQAVTDKVVEGNKQQEQSTKQKNKQQEQSTKSTYSAMTAAMNMYGTAYQIMSNDNMDMTQKFQMFALQAAGQTAIGMLTTNMLQTKAQGEVELPGILGKAASQLGPIAGPIAFAAMTALLGGLMAVAMSSVTKSKSQIAQVTGASVGAGRLATGMLTYAEGNVNELTDPASLTPGRQYNVDGADGKTYRARYMGKGVKTHITNGPEFHLVGEAGREAIIDAKTTRLLQMNETGIWRDIQTLYNGGSISGLSTRRRRGGVRAFADGNVGEFEEMADGGTTAVYGTDGMGMEQMLTALDRNSAIQEALLERLNQPIYAQNILYGPDGLPNVINKLNKEAQRHGEKYL